MARGRFQTGGFQVGMLLVTLVFLSHATLGFAGMGGGGGGSGVRQPRPLRGYDYYHMARDHAEQGELLAALAELGTAFEMGYPASGAIYNDPHLYKLIVDPELRPEMFDLLRTYARGAATKMIPFKERGRELRLIGKVIDRRSGEPVAGALVEIAHADARGMYSEGHDWFNTRLTSWLRTSSEGEFSVGTVRPGPHRVSHDRLLPSHIHISVEAEGYRSYHAAVRFSTEAAADQDVGPVGSENAQPVALEEHLSSSRSRATVTLGLEPLRAGE